MRRIDADALILELETMKYIVCPDNPFSRLCNSEIDCCIEAIEQAPTIEAFTPSFITDLNEVKDWTICGYRVEDLYKLALILRDKKVEDVDLRDFNACFFDGYKRAVKEINESIEISINNIIGGDYN